MNCTFYFFILLFLLFIITVFIYINIYIYNIKIVQKIYFNLLKFLKLYQRLVYNSFIN